MSPETMSRECPVAHSDQIASMIRAGQEAQARMRSMVQDVRNGTVYQSGVDDETLREHIDDANAAREIWELMKEERNALLSVLLEEAWGQFCHEANASPTRLMEFWGGNRKIVTPEMIAADKRDSLARIGSSQRNMTSGVIDAWERLRDEAMGTNAHDPLAVAYTRMQTMNEFASDHDIHCSNAACYLKNGFTGAQQVVYGVAQVIPAVFERTFGQRITPDEYATILRGSYRNFFVRPASLDKSVGIPLMNAPFERGKADRAGFLMDPTMLTIEEGVLKPAVETVPAQVAELSRKTQIGCVALFAKDHRTKQSVNRAFFAHFTGVVERFHIRT